MDGLAQGEHFDGKDATPEKGNNENRDGWQKVKMRPLL